MSQLIAGALNHVHPDAVVPLPATVIPLGLQVVNQGIATQVRATLTIPTGVAVIDPGEAQPID
ncbi:MAG TPA: hypothetical protein ENI80_01750 [Acidiferrobacteraceae bacterium]|nr:hypothetical protein [Acidiferrobacteraceae bacterium]